MLTSADLLKSNPYKDYGFKNPNNNIGAMANRLSFPFFEQAAKGAVFANELEPDRQGAIRAMVNNLNPSNMVANAGARGNKVYNQATSQGQRAMQMLQQRGASMGTQFGALASSQNAGTEASNQMLLDAYSPQQQMGALAMMLQAIQQAPGSGLENLLALQGPVAQKEHDRLARKQSQGMGGLASILGMAGQFAGMGIPGMSPNPGVQSAANSAAQSIWDLI